MMRLALLVVLAAATLAAPVDRKCTPEQWEGTLLGKVAQVAQGRPMVLSFLALASTDYTNKISALHQTVDYDGHTIHLSTVTDFGKMVSYNFNPERQTCNKAEFTDKMEIFCTDTAKPAHSYTLDGRTVDMYELDRSVTGQKVRATFSLYRDNLTPISEVVEQNFAGIPQMVAMQFANMTTGIKDRKVFDIPSYC